MSLANMQGKMSRKEMKEIMAGYGCKCCWTGTSNCSACVSAQTCSNASCATGATASSC